MKRVLLTLFYALGVFLLIAVAIMPEYRYRILFAFGIYVVFLAMVLRYTARNEIVSFYHAVFGARFKYILPGMLVFVIIMFVALIFLDMRILATAKLDMTSKGSISISKAAAKYIEQLNSDVQVIYVRPVNKEDYKSYFNALMQELKDHNDRITYKALHPVLNTLEYSRLKNKASTLIPGNFVVISGDNYLVGERINEKDIVRAINRVVNGDIGICYTKGHGEPDLGDFSEKGGGIMYSMLTDRGVILFPSSFEEWNKCGTLFIADPLMEFKDDELNALINYKGNVVLFGGTSLTSIRKFLSDQGVNILGKQEMSFKDYALRDYEGGVLLDKFYDHPVLNGIKSGVVTAYGYAIDCPDCRPLAGTGDALLYAGKDRLLLFTGEKSSTNFFMRFNGNLRLIYNALSFSFSPDAYMLFSDDKNEELGLFAVSPRYLNVIFWICVVGIPVLFLMLGIYCFKNTKNSKVK
jgi:hypothetical protein